MDTTEKIKPLWRRPLVWIGFILSGLAIGTFIALFDLGQVTSSLLGADPALLAVASLIFIFTYFIRGLRWQLLLTPLQRLPYRQVRDVLWTGFMLNCLLPARAGEIARPLVLWKVSGTSRRGGLATVGVERIFDGIVLVGLISLLAVLFEVPAWARHMGHITSVVLAAALVVSLWLAFHHDSFFAVGERVLFFLPGPMRKKVLGFFERFVAGTRSLRNPSLVAGVAGITFTIWALEMVIYYTVMRAFGVELPFWAAGLCLAVTNFGIAVPSAPGYVGVFEAACSGAIIALGTSKELALSFAIGLHLMMFIWVVGPGLILMWRLGLSFRDVTGRVET